MTVAGLVFWRGAENPQMGSMIASAGLGAATWIALSIAIVGMAIAAFEAWFLLNVVRQQGRFLIRLEALEAALGLGPGTGLPIGQRAPEFQLLSLRGDQGTLATLRRPGQPVLLFFTNPDCQPCDAMLPDVARWQREHADRVTIGVIGRGSVEANREQAEKHDLRTVLLQKEREVSEAYKVDSTPAAVLVSPDGKIGSRIGYGAEGVEDLLRQVLNAAASQILEPVVDEPSGASQARRTSVPAIGQPAPALILSDLDGEPTNLADIRGTSTLCLFWSPACGFCQQMLPALKTWERKRAAWAPRLLIVSTGTVEANRAMGLASQVVLDSEGLAMRAFGATGTPMAVLLDSTGRIASSLAAGEQAVMALARARHPEPVGSFVHGRS